VKPEAILRLQVPRTGQHLLNKEFRSVISRDQLHLLAHSRALENKQTNLQALLENEQAITRLKSRLERWQKQWQKRQ
jgi:hypothetical protein